MKRINQYSRSSFLNQLRKEKLRGYADLLNGSSFVD